MRIVRFDSLERLIERLFAEHREPMEDTDAGEAAFLAAVLSGEGTAIRPPPGDPSEPLAAYLDGALDGEARRVFETGLARSPGEREDLESARTFLDAVGERGLAAPPDLVEAMTAGLAEDAAQTRERGLWQRTVAWIWARPRTVGVLGGTVAVAFSVVLLVSANLDRAVTPFKEAAPPALHETKSPVPVVATPAPAPLPEPDTAIAPDAVPAPPAATGAAQALKQLQNKEMYELRAKQDAGEATGAAYDPCAHRHARRKGAAAGTGKTASSSESANCEKDFADHGVASQPDFGSAPAAADTMPAETAPDATGSTMPSPQPDAPPH